MKQSQTFEDVHDHKILPCRRRGDTLIVQPAGSIYGFDPKTFYTEIANIKGLFQNDDFKNIVLDLSSASYFGTELIGSIVSLGKLVNEKGKAVIAEPSPAMKLILEKMKINLILPIEETTQAAVSKISHETPTAWWKRNASTASLIVVVLAIACLIGVASTTNFFTPIIGTVASRRYSQLTDCLTRIEQSRGTKESEKNWKSLSSSMDNELRPYLEQLRKIEDRDPVQESLYQSTLALWQLCIQDFPPTDERLDEVRSTLGKTANIINEHQHLSLKKPAPVASTDEKSQ